MGRGHPHHGPRPTTWFAAAHHIMGRGPPHASPRPTTWSATAHYMVRHGPPHGPPRPTTWFATAEVRTVRAQEGGDLLALWPGNDVETTPSSTGLAMLSRSPS